MNLKMSYYKKWYKLAQKFLTNGKEKWNFCALLSQFPEERIIDLMLKFNYSDENFAVMAWDIDYLLETNPNLFNKDDQWMNWRADTRSRINYFQDLVAGWIYEDIVLNRLKLDSNIKVELYWSDSNRSILIEKVTNKPDYKISYKWKYLLVELWMSHTWFCYETEYVNLRNNKRTHMVEYWAYFLEMETFALSWKNKGLWIRFAIVGWEELNDYKPEIKWTKETDALHITKEKYHKLSDVQNVVRNTIEKYGNLIIS